MSFRTFTRTWWRRNSEWPDGREPHAGRKAYRATYDTEAEAREACKAFNAKPKTKEQKFLSFKMEYEHV